MINYFITFGLTHSVLFILYKLFLERETQVSLLRGYLLASTILAIIIPLVSLPNVTPIQNMDVGGSVSSYILPTMNSQLSSNQGSLSLYGNWPLVIFILGSSIMIVRLLLASSQIFYIYRKSVPLKIQGRKVRHWEKLQNVFTFYHWIFINKSLDIDLKAVIRHEEAHIKYKHSFDLTFFNLLTIPFWWLPSIWLTLRQLKRLHEYQADSYVLNSTGYKSYLNTLISNTLKINGYTLTHSFNDITLTKRLDFMKRLKKKISLVKLSSLCLAMILTTYIFSCQPKNEPVGPFSSEIFTVVDQMPEFPGGMTAFNEYVQSNLHYPEKALKEKISGRVVVQFIVNTDGRVSDVNILKGLGAGCDKEAKRLVEDSPAWESGSQKGHPVNVRLVLPINFVHPAYPFSENKNMPLKTTSAPSDDAFTKVDEVPTFQGDIRLFYKYVQENLKYPEKARNNGVEGRVFVQFVVDTDGTLTHVRILKGIGYGCDEEAKRVVENSPKWIPGKLKGKNVIVKMVLPITFGNGPFPFSPPPPPPKKRH